jgi:hypothetical protein
MASRYAHRNAAHAASLATRNAHNAAVLRKHANNMRAVTGNRNAIRAELVKLKAAQKEFRQVKRGGHSSHIHKAGKNERATRGWGEIFIDGVKYIYDKTSSVGTIVLTLGAGALVGVGIYQMIQSGQTMDAARAHLVNRGIPESAAAFASTVKPAMRAAAATALQASVGGAKGRLLGQIARKYNQTGS